MSVALFRGGPLDGKTREFDGKPPPEYRVPSVEKATRQAADTLEFQLRYGAYLRYELRCYDPLCRHTMHERWGYTAYTEENP